MKVVDFFGASGVGKSTTYNALVKLGGFTPALDIDYGRSDAILTATMRRDRELRDFVDLIDRVFATAKGPRVNTRRRHTYRSLRMAIQNREDDRAGVVVIDGGLLQRGQAVDRLQSEVAIEDYYRKMPPPDLAVLFTAPLKEVKARNVARGGDHDRSEDAARSAQVHEIAFSVMAERGVRLLRISTEMSPGDNAAIIKGKLASL